MAYLTARNLPFEPAQALEREKSLRGKSLNQVVIDLLTERLGVGTGRQCSNGLARLAGTWAREECETLETVAADQEWVSE